MSLFFNRFGSPRGLPLRAARVACCGVALAASGCGVATGTYPKSEGPDWSLTDRPPQGLGAAREAMTTPPAPPPPSGRAAALPYDLKAATGPREIAVRKGDRLFGLSLQNHVSVHAIMAANHLAATTIVPGQKLVIPGG